MMKKLSLAFILLVINSTAFALSWVDLWQRKDQQAAHALQQGDAKRAFKTFTDPNWQAFSAYRAGAYSQAEKILHQQTQQRASALSFYNLGNTLVALKQYRAAVNAYQRALDLNPDDPDALFNKKLVEKLLKNQKKKSSEDQAAKHSKEQGKSLPNNTNKQQKQKQNQNQSQQNRQDKRSKNKFDPHAQNKAHQNHKDSKTQQNKRQSSSQSKQTKRLSLTQQNQREKLKQIPDNPGELLAQKFRRDFYLRHTGP